MDYAFVRGWISPEHGPQVAGRVSCFSQGASMDLNLLKPLALATALLVVGINGVFAPYPRNFLKLRWGLGDGMPWDWKVRIPKIAGCLLLLGALVILVDVCINCFGPNGQETLATSD